MSWSVIYSQTTVNVAINGANPTTVISKHIYGHFAEHLGRCVYDGFWVSDTSTLERKDRLRMDVVNALKKIKVPNLRWPGGCYADEYHWRDGIGERSKRPKTVNTHWGMITEITVLVHRNFLNYVTLSVVSHISLVM